MNRLLKTVGAAFKMVAVALLTLALLIVGMLNLRDRVAWTDASDGVFWMEATDGAEGLASLVAEDVAPEGPGYRAGIREGDRLLGIEGRSVPNLGVYAEILYDAGPEATLRYTVETSASVRSLPVSLTARNLFTVRDGMKTLLAFLHLGIGVFVFWRGGRKPFVRHFYLICLTAFVLWLFSYTPELGALDLCVYTLSAIAFLLLPALFLHFCLSFPDARPRTAFVLLSYSFSGLLGLTHLLWAAGRLAPVGLARSTAVGEILDMAELVYFCTAFLAGGLLLRQRYVQAQKNLENREHLGAQNLIVCQQGTSKNPADKARRSEKSGVYIPVNEHFRARSNAVSGVFRGAQQMKWIACGTLAGIIPFSLIYLLPTLLGARADFSRFSFAMDASMLFLALVPLSVGYAVLRFRLMDVEDIARKSAACLLTALALFSAVVLGMLVFSEPLRGLTPHAGLLVAALAALSMALLFQPLRRFVQTRLDRAFYRNCFQDRATLLDFARALSAEINLQPLARNILDRIVRTFPVDRAAIFLEDAAHPEIFRFIDGVDAGGHAGDGLALEGFAYRQDMLVQGRCVGTLALGALPKGKHFTSEDLELLSALSGYAAVALENAALHQSLQSKAEEIGRLKDYTENILESIDVAVLSVTAAGRVRSCNRAFEELYDAPRRDIIGALAENLLSPDVVAAIRNAAGMTGWAAQTPANIFKLAIKSLEGRPLIVNLCVRPLPIEDAETSETGTLLVMEDITGRMQLEEQLLQAEKLSSVGLLAAGVAHEINTPLTGISSYTQMLLKEDVGAGRRKALLEKIEKQTFRASEIVGNLLNFSRMGSRLGVGEFAAVDINQVICDSLSLLDHQLDRNRIRIASDLGEALAPVYGNTGKLQQVFVNLFLNARDAMSAGGELGIRTGMGDSMVIVDISDTGGGIPQENLKKIFDPFFTTKGSGRGTGLGLAVSYGIIQEHGGGIFVESGAGKGTHFTLKLPARLN